MTLTGNLKVFVNLIKPFSSFKIKQPDKLECFPSQPSLIFVGKVRFWQDPALLANIKLL
jgi:hypothetical protein